MAFKLKNWLEEAVAQVIPGDNRTAATVRQQRTVAPAQTVRPTPPPTNPLFRQSVGAPTTQPQVRPTQAAASTASLFNNAYAQQQQKQIVQNAQVGGNDPVAAFKNTLPGRAIQTIGHTLQGVSNAYNTVKSTPAVQSLSNPVTRFVDNNLIEPAMKTESNLGKLLQFHNPYTGSGGQQAGQALQDAINVASVVPIGKAAGLATKGLSAVKQGAVQGAKVGAGFGAAQGVSTSLQNRQNLPQSLKTIGTNTVVGGVLGAATGAAVPAIGAGVRAAGPALRRANTNLGEGGSVKLPTPSLRQDAEEAVFKQNPMLPENQPKLVGADAGAPQQPLPTFDTKRVPIRDKVFRSTRSIIERQGQSGKQLAGMLQAGRDTNELFLADVQQKIPTVRKLKGKSFENFVDATQGLAQPKDAKVAQAVQEWQAAHPAIRDRAVKAGLDVGDLGQNYYPHFIDYEKVFKDKNTYNDAINHLVKTGQAATPEEAIKALGYARDVSRNRQFGNLESSRLLDLPYYDKTPNSLVSYLSGSGKRIAQAETFGAKDEKALKLIKNVGVEGGDTEAAKNAYDVAVGAKRYNPTTSKISGGIRQANSTTSLGLGALTNSTQSVNTGIVTGHLRTLGAMVKQLNPAQRKFVAQTGTVADAVLNDIKEQTGFTGKVLSKITAPGFGAVEKFNRSVAAVAGRDYALSLAKRGKVSTLRKLGVTGDITGRTLTEAQQIQAARKIVEKTQFKVDPQDLPGWADSPGGKVVAQFRTFSYAQGKFFAREVLKPLARKDARPLARLIVALPIGYGVSSLRGGLTNRAPEDNAGRRVVDAWTTIGGPGLAGDAIKAFYPLGGKYIPPDRGKSMATGFIGGPSVGKATDLVGGLYDISQRKNVPAEGVATNRLGIPAGDGKYLDATSLARTGLRQIPIVGTRAANSLLPYKVRDDANSNSDNFKKGVNEFFGALAKPFSANASAATPDSTKGKTLDESITAANKSSKDLNKKLTESFSKQENSLRKLSKTERQSLINSGKYTKEQFKALDDREKKRKQELGMLKVEDSIKGNKRGSELNDYISSLSKDERKTWESGSLDTKYQDLYDLAGTVKNAEMPDLPKTNATLSAYTDYLKAESSGATGLKLNAAKNKFLKDSYGSILNEGSKEVLGNYTTGEKLDAIGSGAISRQDFDDAVAYDNMLITLGLTSSPQVSNTIRRRTGHSDAPKTSATSTPRSSSTRATSGKGRKKGKRSYTSLSANLSSERSLRSLLKKATL